MTTEQPRPGTTGGDQATAQADHQPVTGGYDPALGHTAQVGPEGPAATGADVPTTAESVSRSRSSKRTWLAGAALVGVGLAAGSGITAAIVVPGASVPR